MSHNDFTTTTYLPVPSNQVDNLNRALAAQGLPDLIRNPALKYIDSLNTEVSRNTMIRALNDIADILGYERVTTLRPDERCTTGDRMVENNHTWLFVHWHDLRYEHTSTIRSALVKRYSRSSANKALSALRRVLKEAWRLELMSAEDYHRAADLANFKARSKKKSTGRALDDGELSALLTACLKDDTAAGLRDAAMIAFMWFSGARRASVVNLDMSHYDPETGKGELINAKGGKDITFYLKGGAQNFMNDWLTLRGDHPGPIFQPITQKGAIIRFDDDKTPRRMTPNAIYHILKKRGKEAGVKHFSPHDMRRSIASKMLDEGIDVSTVADWLGHESTDTTRGYDRGGEKRKASAAGKIHVPYKRHVALGTLL